MWKNRGFLKGMGVGFIIGAILLQLMITVQETDKRIQDSTHNPNPEKQADISMFDEKTIKDRAASLGLQVFDKDVKVYTQAQVDDQIKQAVEAAAKQPGDTPTPPPEVTVFIYSGMNAENVAEYLNRSGVIVDRRAFEQELLKNQLVSKIRSDLYTFHLNESIKDVIARITTPQR